MRQELEDIIRRLERLAPSHRDPFAYHEAKSEILHDLRRLAAANDNQAPAQETGTNYKGYTSIPR